MNKLFWASMILYLGHSLALVGQADKSLLIDSLENILMESPKELLVAFELAELYSGIDSSLGLKICESRFTGCVQKTGLLWNSKREIHPGEFTLGLQ